MQQISTSVYKLLHKYCSVLQSLIKFATFDIKEFFSSIKECPLKNAISFAEQHTEISENNKSIIYHARKSLLFNGQHF